MLNIFTPLPQILENITVRNKNIVDTQDAKMKLRLLPQIWVQTERVLVRKSGTEPKIKNYDESNNKKLILKCLKRIKKSI